VSGSPLSATIGPSAFVPLRNSYLNTHEGIQGQKEGKYFLGSSRVPGSSVAAGHGVYQIGEVWARWFLRLYPVDSVHPVEDFSVII
jgi:hypothetical protein